ncbi:ABC transporter permease [Aureimonas endophytica]|uniref:ABC transporter permease n=2 Tax=Aureimonas endophytica TaxID=2027858 RepID=A0A916ZVY7_9HYPH|nr:TRAP transporter large permease subunit [Aureimonas endophytica]GGE15377.1 ABC transporter permease [Aureimonas endophytica]
MAEERFDRATAPSTRLRSARRIRHVLGAACGAVIALLLVEVLVSVAMRYLFGSALFGADEAALWLFQLLVALGCPLAVEGALAMRFDFVTERLPPAGRRLAALVADAFVLAAAATLLGGGALAARAIGGLSPALGLPEWLRPALMAAGGATTLLLLVLERSAAGRLPRLLASALMVAGMAGLAFGLGPSAGLAPSLAAGLLALLGLLAGAPLPHLLLASAAFADGFGGALPPPALVATTLSGVAKFLLLAVPFFLLVGSLLSDSGAAGALVRFAAALVGHRRGGLAQTTLLTSVLFSGASGSSIANAAFGARTFAPQLAARGYAPAEAAAIVAATSTLDNVIPPSIAFLLLAAATDLPIGRLLALGFVAGGVMAAMLAVAIALRAREGDRQPRADAGERRAAFLGALPAFGLGAIVVAGIRFGIVTVTEAAALAAGYTLLLALGGRIGWRALGEAFTEAGTGAAAIGLLIGASAPFAFLLAVDDAAGAAGALASSFGDGAWQVLLAANLVLLVAGLVLDIGVAILLLGPILVPVVAAAGIDPVHFGVLLVVNLMTHGLMPPIGILIYVVAAVTKLPPAALFRAVLPYLGALLVALLILSVGALLVAA